MSRANFFGRPALALVCSIAFAFQPVAFAQIATGPATPLEVFLEKEPVSTVDPYYRAFVTAQSAKVPPNKFTFIMPQGYRLQNDPTSGRLVLANKDGDRTITFTILGPWTLPDAEPSSAACHTFAAGKTNHVVFINEAPFALAQDKGRLLDLEWRTPEDILQHKRAIYLGTSAGLLEFTATSGETGFRDIQFTLEHLIKSFHYATDGKLRFMPLSDKI